MQAFCYKFVISKSPSLQEAPFETQTLCSSFRAELYFPHTMNKLTLMCKIPGVPLSSACSLVKLSVWCRTAIIAGGNR